MSLSMSLIWQGFALAASSQRQQKGRRYHPAMLLKIYVYGYLNRVQSLTMSGQLAATAATCTVPTRNGGGSHPDKVCRLVQDNGLKHKTKRG